MLSVVKFESSKLNSTNNVMLSWMKTIIQVLCIAFETNEIGDDPFTSYEIKCGLLFLHKKLVNFKMLKSKLYYARAYRNL